MVAYGQAAGGRSWASVAACGKAKGNWGYWVCSSGQGREWNWCSLWKCRSCGRVAPPWVEAAQPPAAAAGQEPPVADAEGFVVQPRGRKARRQAKRTAARAASAGAASLAGVSEASSAQPSAVERHRQEVKRIEDFLAAPGGSIGDGCLQSLRAALDRERRRLSAAEAALAGRRRADIPLPRALHGAGNAPGKLVRQGRAKEQALLKAEEAREAACAEAVEECRVALEAHREGQRAAEARQAKEVGAAFVGTDLLGMVFGLIQQVEALPQGFAAGNGEAAFAEVAKQIAAAKGRSSWADTPLDVSDEDLDGDEEERRGQAARRGEAHGAWPSAQPLARDLANAGAALLDDQPLATTAAAADERVAETLDGRSGAKVSSVQRTRMTAQEACIGEARLGPQPALESDPRGHCPLRAGLEVLGCNGNVWNRSAEVLEAFFHAHQHWPQLVLLQETRLTHERLPGARALARRLGYTAFFHEAVATDQPGPNAASGGVAILVRAGLQAEESACQLPAALRHRLIGVEVTAPSGLRLHALAGYFQHSLGPRGINLDLFSSVSDLVAFSLDLPWVLQADVNMEPEPLQELGWPAAVRGQVPGPSEATCCAQGLEHVYDWFVASSDLATCTASCATTLNDFASCATTLNDFGLHPHSPVLLRLQCVRCDALVEVPSRPARFPEVEVKGLRSREDALAQAFTVGRRGKVSQKDVAWSWAQGSRPTCLSAAFGEWIEAAEGTLTGIHGIAPGDLPRYLGRAAGPKTRRMPFSALVQREARLKYSMLTHRLRSCLAVALQRLRAEQASRWHPNHSWWYEQEAAARAKPLDEATQEEAGLRSALLPGASDEKWGDLAFHAGVKGCPTAIAKLQSWLLASQRPLVGMDAVDQLTRTWQRLWLQEGFSSGVGAHRWDVGSWTLPPITLEALQQACKRYGPSVGLGCDNLQPRQLLLLPVALQLRLIDILTAFEDEPSSIRGQRFGFNLKLLRGLLAIYQAPGIVLAGGMASAPFGASGTVLAGCACATAVAKLPVLGGLLAAGAQRPLATLRNLVGDVSLQAVGSARLVVDQLAGASGEVLRHLRAHHLPLNEGKSVFLASSAQVADGLAASWAALGFEVKRGSQARSLGTDANVTRRGVHEGGARAVGGLSRARRLRTLGSAGAAVVHMHRAGPTAAMLWGRTVTGVPDGELHSWRLAAARSAGKLPKGASLGLRPRAIEVQRSTDLDPSPALVRAAVQVAASLLQTGEVPLMMFATCLAEAERRHDSIRAPWVNCKNPVDALALSLLRVGWRLSAGHILHTDGGHTLDMLIMAPRELGLLAAAGARRASDRAEMTRLGHGAAPSMPLFWDALGQVIGPRGRFSCREKAAVVSYLSNAHWPQTRLFASGERGHPRCCACGEVRGSLWHWLFECQSLAAERRDSVSARLLRCATRVRQRGEEAGECFSRCWLPQPPQTAWRKYATAATKPNAHLWSAVYASLDVDSLNVNKVAAHCTETDVSEGRISEYQWLGNAHADTSLDVDSLNVNKVAAHCTETDVSEGRISEYQWLGNAHADRLAKAGAALHRASAAARREFFGAMEVVRELSRWIAQASIVWQDRASKDCEGLPERDERRTAVTFAVPLEERADGLRAAPVSESGAPPAAVGARGEQAGSRPAAVGAWASAARDGGAALGALVFAVAGHALARARCGEDGDQQEIIACTRCGAYARLGGLPGPQPKLRERCPGATGLPRSLRDQKSRWERKGAEATRLRKEAEVPQDARVRFLKWLGVQPDAPAGVEGSASVADAAGGDAGCAASSSTELPAAAGGAAAGAGSRQAWLEADGLDEESLLSWAEEAEEARLERQSRKRRRDDGDGGD
ncbi:unnamed protein product [Prorocentrum cordatum]|uniref:Uncharacterized protein n=1 Tax=Prorocentrum cordatum TaxID=2364126 RepID=A0ABN9PB27_9DINO|nr:unnamed protein product [Polarella glacialis]